MFPLFRGQPSSSRAAIRTEAFLGADGKLEELDRKLQEFDRKLLELHREMRSSACQVIRASKPSGSIVLVTILTDQSTHPVSLRVGDMHDLMKELVDARDSDPRRSPFVYMGIFDLTRKNREPRMILDMMNTGDAWQVGEMENE